MYLKDKRLYTVECVREHMLACTDSIPFQPQPFIIKYPPIVFQILRGLSIYDPRMHNQCVSSRRIRKEPLHDHPGATNIYVEQKSASDG